MKSSEAKLGNSTVELSKSVRAVGSVSDDDHGANIVGFQLAA